MRKVGKLEGWKVERLGDVCEIFNGGTPDTKVPKFWGGDILWITPKDMGKLESIYVDDTARKITDAGMKNSSAKILPVNSVILSSRAPIGHLAINTKEITTNQGCKGIVPKKELSTLFLYYFLENSVELLNNLGSGTTFKELSGSKLAEVQIPIPPLPEQQRIVSVLDEAFASIVQAKSNAERNLVNARELFDATLQEIFTKRGKGWEDKTVGDVSTHSLGKMLDKQKNRGNFQKYLRNINVRWFDFDLSDVGEMRFLDDEKEKYTAIKGDLLICEGGYPGRAAIWQEDYPIFFQKAIHRVRFHKPEYTKWFLYFLYLSDINGNLKKYLTGTGIQHFTGQALDRFVLPIAPLAEQRAIVGRLEALSAETGRLEEIYQRKVESLEELKRSVLGKAFEGEL